MSGLNQQDLEILTSYAKAGNRELYWNYLSQLPGADGYGTLALGVVRNDSLPGRVANGYAQEHARTQHDTGSRFPNVELSERQWESFGQTLLLRDLEARQSWMSQQRADLALNLPGADVMVAHDRAFEQHRLDPNCWTPRVLLQAALEKSGPQKLEHRDLLLQVQQMVPWLRRGSVFRGRPVSPQACVVLLSRQGLPRPPDGTSQSVLRVRRKAAWGPRVC